MVESPKTTARHLNKVAGTFFSQNGFGYSPKALTSSLDLGWKNILVERHLAPPGERLESAHEYHLIELACGRSLSRGEQRYSRGSFRPYTKEPDTISLYADGVRPAVRPFTSTELIVFALDSRFVSEVATEAGLSISRGHQRIGFRDTTLSKLVRIIEEEITVCEAASPLFVDHLTYALTLRLLSHDVNTRGTLIRDRSVPHRSLDRVFELMRSSLCAELDLKILAEASGFSRNHFLRIFYAATKCTPHRFLIQMRIDKAQSMMRDKSLSLLDIAVSCGFNSNAHLSRAFRQILGITPREYRRSL